MVDAVDGRPTLTVVRIEETRSEAEQVVSDEPPAPAEVTTDEPDVVTQAQKKHRGDGKAHSRHGGDVANGRRAGQAASPLAARYEALALDQAHHV